MGSLSLHDKKATKAPAPKLKPVQAKSPVLPPLQFALDYGKRGFPVLPLYTVNGGGCSCEKTAGCKPGKHPLAELAPTGSKSATTDPALIKQWWAKQPTANVGIVTGAASGLLVLDVDPCHGGDKSLAELEATHGPLPATLEAKTGGGGRHLCFKHPGGTVKNKVNFRAGLDVRGDGGYIVAPPSLHVSGKRYEWANSLTPPAAPPTWLLDLMGEKPSLPPAAAGPKPSSPPHDGRIHVGERNTRLTSLAGTMRRAGMNAVEIEAALGEVNAARCDPPLPVSEVRSIAQSVGQYPPAPRPARRAPPEPWQPFPLDALPEPMRAYVGKGAAALGCDPAYIAVPMLAGVAGAVGNARALRLKSTWIEPVMVWAAVVAPSGTVKSPALDLALKHPRARQDQWMKEYEAALAQYEEAMNTYAAAQGQGKKPSKHVAPTPGKQDKPKEPVARRLLCQDTTVEALADRLLENPRGLLVDRDELDGHFSSFGAYKQGRGGDEAKWLTMHAARHLIVDRKGGPRKTISVPRAAVSIAGTIQPGVLRHALTRKLIESGMAARFFFAMPPRTVKKWNDTVIAADVDAAMAGVVEKLLALEFDPAFPGDGKPVEVRLTKNAHQAWVAFYDEQASEQNALADDTLLAALSKLEGGAARLALLIHLMRAAAGDPTTHDTHVDPASMNAGITLSRWFAREARRVYAVLRQTDQEHQEHTLLEFIRGRGDQVTARVLQRARPGQFRTRDEARHALDALVAAGCGKWVKVMPKPQAGKPKGGRPSEVFRLTDQPVDEED